MPSIIAADDEFATATLRAAIIKLMSLNSARPAQDTARTSQAILRLQDHIISTSRLRACIRLSQLTGLEKCLNACMHASCQ